VVSPPKGQKIWRQAELNEATTVVVHEWLAVTSLSRHELLSDAMR
jgi:hypothetical protein